METSHINSKKESIFIYHVQLEQCLNTENELGYNPLYRNVSCYVDVCVHSHTI